MKGAINYVTIAKVIFSHAKITCEDNMLFSHVEISSFRAKAYLVFHLVFQILKKIKLEKTAFIFVSLIKMERGSPK